MSLALNLFDSYLTLCSLRDVNCTRWTPAQDNSPRRTTVTERIDPMKLLVCLSVINHWKLDVFMKFTGVEMFQETTEKVNVPATCR